MFRFGLFCIFGILLYQLSCINSCIKDDYYWRLYFANAVPDDAFVVGRDVDGKNTYVGLAYIKDGGLVPAQIFHGMQEVEVPWGEAIKKDKYIYILCGPQTNFRWLRTDTKHLHLDLLDKQPVLGGFQEGRGYFYIARIFLEGAPIIGKVHQFIRNEPFMAYTDYVINHERDNITSFEVLHYVEFDIDERISVN